MFRKNSSQPNERQRQLRDDKANVNSPAAIKAERSLFKTIKNANLHRLIELGVVETAIDVARAEVKSHAKLAREMFGADVLEEDEKLVYVNGSLDTVLIGTPDGPAISLGEGNPTVHLAAVPDAPEIYDDNPFTDDQIRAAEDMLNGLTILQGIGVLPHLANDFSGIGEARQDDTPIRR